MRKYSEFPISINLLGLSAFTVLVLYFTVVRTVTNEEGLQLTTLVFLFAFNCMIVVIFFVLIGVITKAGWPAIGIGSRSPQEGLLNLWLMARFLTVATVLFYTLAHRELGLINTGNEGQRAVTHDGLTSLYFTIVTWTTLGYGDVLPPIGPGRFIAAMGAITGSVIMAEFVAAIVATANLITRPVREAVLTEPSIWQTAYFMLRQHGVNADAECVGRGASLAAAGDESGAAVWNQVRDAIRELQKPPPSGMLERDAIVAEAEAPLFTGRGS